MKVHMVSTERVERELLREVVSEEWKWQRPSIIWVGTCG